MSLAKLFIQGMKEPLLITVEQGEKLNKMLEDSTIPEESRINVAQGKWIGAKRLIKYITFEVASHSEKQTQTFSREIVDNYRKEIADFCNGEPYTTKMRMAWWEKKGAVRVEKMMSKVPGIGEVWTPIIKNIPLYQSIRDLEDFVADLDMRAYQAERHNDRRLEESIEKITDKMTLKDEKTGHN